MQPKQIYDHLHAIEVHQYIRHDATSLAQGVRRGEFSARDVLAAATARLDAVNPKLNAVIHDLRLRAETQLRSLPLDAPFAGVPTLVKDLNAAIAGAPLHDGSRAYSERTSAADSEFVARLRAAGFVFLGKTNTPEFGFVPYTEPAAHGPTHNPWDLTRTPGGSSGGSAAAVAAGIAPIATASDGGGSIRVPASCCGLVGLKPSRGLIPSAPYGPDQWNYAVTEGCVSRTVRDTAAFLDAVAGPAPGDAFLVRPPSGGFSAACAKTVQPLRIAYSTQNPLHGAVTDPACVEAVQRSLELCRELGHEVHEVSLPYRSEHLTDVFAMVVYGEAAVVKRRLLATSGGKARAAHLETATQLTAAMGEVYSAADYAWAKAQWSDLTREIGLFYQRYDLILTPTLGSQPFVTGALAPSPGEERLARLLLRVGGVGLVKRQIAKLASDIFGYLAFTPFANMTGQPSISLPLHWTSEGLPIGAMFTARIGEDATLLQLARQLELAQPWAHRYPQL